MIRYTIHALDVWGNEVDGYEVNDVHPSQGTLELAEEFSDWDLFDALALHCGVKTPKHGELEVIGDDEVLYIDFKGKPVFELRRVI